MEGLGLELTCWLPGLKLRVSRLLLYGNSIGAARGFE